MIGLTRRCTFFTFILACIFFAGCQQKDEKQASIQTAKTDTTTNPFGLAKTPPMGWNSWNPFGKNVSEKVIRETADSFVNTGLKDAGFTYIVMDDFWSGGRDSVTGLLYPD